MLGKVLFKLLLVLTWNLAAEARNCNRQISLPTSCMSINSNIQLTKQSDHYDLQLCSNGQCLPAADSETWIKCDRICAACASMANASHCGTNRVQCERKVSTFLDNYCSSNTPSTSTTTRTTTVRPTETTTTTHVETTTLPCETVTHQRTTTTTVNVTIYDITNPAEKSSQTSTSVQPIVTNNRNDKLGGSANGAPVAALGALLGLSMILLLIVTAGWVWTLCAMKRKKSERAAR